MNYKDYIDDYIVRYGHPPEFYLLKKYYPDECNEEDAAKPKETNIYAVPPKVNLIFGGETDG